ncbi:TetR/AcrR family transcriptional regulator [Bacillaceae bacterium SIJ1]|uniref:TetR/AcrR family transcriptional regulator n=1 Tax=Litoribacterium kuwaitense TaxID=1398745 RepID=UPI0013EA8854|nr:TetR/AcrR family transcriptional regulator [Litoribacterium kuwaitense]NGP45366.1 TetR/AcrR family transcriptional regulator [Litoribacterium kuwaitense]
MNTSQKILHEAIRLFADQSYSGTSMADIAAKVGIKKPSLYNHYTNKDNLYLSCADEAMNQHVEFFTTAEQRFDHLPPPTQLRTMVTESSLFFANTDAGRLYKSLLVYPPEVHAEKLKQTILEAETKVTAVLRRVLQKGQIDGSFKTDQSLDDIVAALFCLMDGIFLEQFLYDKETYEKRIIGSWNVFLSGLATPSH